MNVGSQWQVCSQSEFDAAESYKTSRFMSRVGFVHHWLPLKINWVSSFPLLKWPFGLYPIFRHTQKILLLVVSLHDLVYPNTICFFPKGYAVETSAACPRLSSAIGRKRCIGLVVLYHLFILVEDNIFPILYNIMYYIYIYIYIYMYIHIICIYIYIQYQVYPMLIPCFTYSPPILGVKSPAVCNLLVESLQWSSTFQALAQRRHAQL